MSAEETDTLEEGAPLQTPPKTADDDPPGHPPGLTSLPTNGDEAPPSKIQSMEMDMAANDTDLTEDELEAKSTHEDDDDDMERLLNGSVPSSTNLKSTHVLCGHERVGNMTILFPRLYYRTGWGIIGPHWFGPVFVTVFLLFASLYFTRESLQLGLGSAILSLGFTILTFYNLWNASLRDPGIVRPTTAPPPRRSRWCDACQTYQPPDGAHCPDCNVCVAGFDHHCVWMGTCIGRNNFKQFLRFNLSWLGYVVYVIVWLSILGPFTQDYHNKHRGSSHEGGTR